MGTAGRPREERKTFPNKKDKDRSTKIPRRTSKTSGDIEAMEQLSTLKDIWVDGDTSNATSVADRLQAKSSNGGLP